MSQDDGNHIWQFMYELIAAINYEVSKNLKTHEVEIKRGKDKAFENICVRLVKSKGFTVTMGEEIIKISW